MGCFAVCGQGVIKPHKTGNINVADNISAHCTAIKDSSSLWFSLKPIKLLLFVVRLTLFILLQEMSVNISLTRDPANKKTAFAAWHFG